MGRLATDPAKFRVPRIKKPCANPECDVVMFLPPCKAKKRFHNKSCKTSYQNKYNEKWMKGAALGRRKGAKKAVLMEKILKRPPMEIYKAGYKRGWKAGTSYANKWGGQMPNISLEDLRNALEDAIAAEDIQDEDSLPSEQVADILESFRANTKVAQEMTEDE